MLLLTYMHQNIKNIKIYILCKNSLPKSLPNRELLKMSLPLPLPLPVFAPAPN